jgi:putative membrane-bound dehydrogenase-like protein
MFTSMKSPICLIAIALCIFCQSCEEAPSTPDGFQIEPDFTLERVAAEPLIKDPVDLEFNERGDAMVLEMPGYPFEDTHSRLLVLKDQDQDGVYDQTTVFAENLQLASSFMPYQKGALVAAPPYLLFLHDEDQNYVAEKVDTLMGGFSNGNLQHNFNGLTHGLDGWIYAANGGNDGRPYWWGDTTTALDLRGQDFRFNLKTRTLERLGESSGGFELAVDEYGRIFETHNLTHISHLVFPERYKRGKTLLQKHSLENISDHEENGLARIYPIGEQESRVNHPEQSGYFSGSCGITYYGGDALGDTYQNTVWVADVVLNLIHIDKISPQGASFSASRIHEKRDFLASSDRSFRPVNMSVGPDGAMYVVDMYRQVIEHPEWIPDDIEKTLDLEAGKDKGRIYRITKSGDASAFDVKQFDTNQGLVQSLSHPNQWVRNTAHRLILEQPLEASTVELLHTALDDPDPLVNIHALHILSAQQALKPNSLISLLESSSPEVTEVALQVAETMIHEYPDLVELCIDQLGHKDQRVRMQAALSLSTIDPQSSLFAKIESDLIDGLMATAQQPNDIWNHMAITLAAKDKADQLFMALLENDSPVSEELLASLAVNASQASQGLRVVLQSIASSNLGNMHKEFILQQVNQRLPGIPDASLESDIALLEASGDSYLMPALATLRHKLNLPPSARFLKMSRTALAEIRKETLPDSVRLQQLALVELLPYQEKSQVLFDCLDNQQPLKIQEGALRQLSTHPETEIGERIVSMWQELSPQTRRHASDLLLYMKTHHDALLTGLENGTINIGEMNFDLERRRTLLWWTDDENTKRRAERLFSDAGVTTRKQAVEKMKPALVLAGSVMQGAEVFQSVCSNCHVYGAQGQEVGPVLTEINRKSKETLLHDIIDPNAAVDTKYINHRLETKAGIVHMGIVASETDQQITLMKMGGEQVVVDKDEVQSFRSTGTSLMMEGLENSMTTQEMADLLAFLQNGA